MNTVNSSTKVTAIEYVVVDFTPHAEVVLDHQDKRADIRRVELRFEYDFGTNEWGLAAYSGTAYGAFIKKDGTPGVQRKFFLYDIPHEVRRQWAEEFKPVHSFTLTRVG